MVKIDEIKNKIKYFKDKINDLNGGYIVSHQSEDSLIFISKDDLNYINIDINKGSFDFMISSRAKAEKGFKIIGQYKFKIAFTTKKQKDFIKGELTKWT